MDRANEDRARALRAIPSLDLLMRRLGALAAPRALVLREARAFLEALREKVLSGGLGGAEVEAACASPSAENAIAALCEASATLRHRRVLNATGVVLHTGLGRAPLPRAALDAITGAAGYAIVEVDPGSGERNQREEAVAALLRELVGLPGALVVNNNAAMTVLVLAALAAGKEVVVSRGELVEIGGGFRMPDVMARAGCRMVEVGATNKTRVDDYERAIVAETAMLLKVHPSNFRMQGFTAAASLTEVAKLARRHGLHACEDLGSGLLWDDALPGLEEEPRVRASAGSGAHLVWFSGDKLLGGPQCGILVGERDLVARVRAHPLYRAFRCDKLTLAALEATLRVYRDGAPLQEIPTLRMLSAEPHELSARARDLCDRLAMGRVVASDSFAGSGANPARPLPSFAVALSGGERLLDALRLCRPTPVFARIAMDEVLLDARTLLLEDLDEVVAAVRSATDRLPPKTSR